MTLEDQSVYSTSASAAAGAATEAPAAAPPWRATRRRWWLAALLALLGPPAGQIYNGQPRKGILSFLGCLLLASIAAVLTIVHMPLWVPLSLFLVAVALQIFLVADAIAQAVRTGADHRIHWYNRWFVFLPLLVVLHFTPRLWLLAIHQVVETYYIPSQSSEPSVLKGDHIFVDNWSFRFAPPRRGDLVMFRSPENTREVILKRVVAVGGDRVEIRDKQFLLDGQATAEPYAEHTDAHTMPPGNLIGRRDHMAEQAVPEGSLFVLGDNRDNSYDSRFYGPIPQASVVGGGRVRVYWSWDAARRTVRWGRTGLFLK